MSTATEFHGYVPVRARGTITLPPELRRRFHLDSPGAQLEFTERADGVVELRAALPVPADEAWFWTQRNQQRERAVDAHIAAGETTVHTDGDAFLRHLEALDEEAGRDERDA